MPSQRKIDIVEKLKEKVGRAKALVFADYQGLTHKQLEELKRAVKNAGADLVVTKNTLLKLALAANNKQLTTNNLGGSTATLFAYSDILAPLKELAKTIKLFKLPVIKFGIIDGRETAGVDIIRLSTLPSRDVLIAQLVGQMQAPIYGLHRTLTWDMRKLILTLKTLSTKS